MKLMKHPKTGKVGWHSDAVARHLLAVDPATGQTAGWEVLDEAPDKEEIDDGEIETMSQPVESEPAVPTYDALQPEAESTAKPKKKAKK